MADAVRAEMIDSQMWLDWLDATNARQAARATFLRARFSGPLDSAQKEWLAGVTIDAQGNPSSVPSGTPMDQASYIVPLRVKADDLAAQAESKLAEASQASQNSTRLVVLAVVLAVVLLLGGIATKFANPQVQAGLLIASLALLAFSIARFLMLPQLF